MFRFPLYDLLSGQESNKLVCFFLCSSFQINLFFTFLRRKHFLHRGGGTDQSVTAQILIRHIFKA